MDKKKGLISSVLVATMMINTTIVANAEDAAKEDKKGFGAVTLLSAENAQVTNPSKSEKLKGSIVLGEKADHQEHEVKFLLGTYNENKELQVLKQDEKELVQTEKVKFEEDGQNVETMFDFDSTPYKDKKIVLQIEVDGEILESNELTSQVRITYPKIEAEQVLQDEKLITKVTYEDFAPQEVTEIRVVQMDSEDSTKPYKLEDKFVSGNDRIVPKQTRTDQTTTSAVEGSKDVIAVLEGSTPNELYTTESLDKEIIVDSEDSTDDKNADEKKINLTAEDASKEDASKEDENSDGDVPTENETAKITDEKLVTPFVTVISDNTVIAEVKVTEKDENKNDDEPSEEVKDKEEAATSEDKDNISKEEQAESDIVKPTEQPKQSEQPEKTKVVETKTPEKLVQTGAENKFTFSSFYNWLYNLK